MGNFENFIKYDKENYRSFNGSRYLESISKCAQPEQVWAQQISYIRETSIQYMLKKPAAKKELLDLFDAQNKDQKKVVEDYLFAKGETNNTAHTVFNGMKHAEKVNFCKALAVLECSEVHECQAFIAKHFPASCKQLDELFRIPVQDKASYSYFALYSRFLAARTRFGKKEIDSLRDFVSVSPEQDCMNDHVNVKCKNLNSRVIDWTETGDNELALAIYWIGQGVFWGNKRVQMEKEQLLPFVNLFAHMWPSAADALPLATVMGRKQQEICYDWLDYVLNHICNEEGNENHVEPIQCQQYKQYPKTGNELFEILDTAYLVNGYHFTTSNDLMFDYWCSNIGLSPLNIDAVMELGFNKDTLRPRIAHEAITKNDRETAILVGQYTLAKFIAKIIAVPVKIRGQLLEAAEADKDISDENQKKYETIAGNYNKYLADISKNPVVLSLLDREYPDQMELFYQEDKSDMSIVYQMSSEEDMFCEQKILEVFNSAHFQRIFNEMFVSALLNILTTRVYERDVADGVYAAIYTDLRDTSENKVIAKLRKENEDATAALKKATAALKTSKENENVLYRQLEALRQKERNDGNKNAIIAQQKEENKRLAAENEAMRAALNDDGDSYDEVIPQTIRDIPLSDNEVHLRLAKLLEKYSVVMVDGHENFCNYLVTEQPNLKVFPTHGRMAGKNDLQDADYVFCKSCAYGSHSAYHVAKSACAEAHVPFQLLSTITNIKQSERELYGYLIEEFPNN